MIQRLIENEKQMLNLGAKLASFFQPGLSIGLDGNLGAGKTTLVRGFLRGMGYKGTVKSPTYTLVETYIIENKKIHHFDLYRIAHPEELEFIGMRDYFNPEDMVLIEWPNQGVGCLPTLDINCFFDIHESQRTIELIANSAKGVALLTHLNKDEVG